MLSAKLLDVDDIGVTSRSAFNREYFLVSKTLVELRSLKAMCAQHYLLAAAAQSLGFRSFKKSSAQPVTPHRLDDLEV